MEKFYMVYNLTTGKIPCVKHQYDTQAKAEAERLARLQPGEKFAILEAIEFCKVEPIPVKWDTFEDPLPF